MPRRRSYAPPPDDAVGTCPSCGVAFAGDAAEAARVAHLLDVHASICPGGDRTGDVVRPFAPPSRASVHPAD